MQEDAQQTLPTCSGRLGQLNALKGNPRHLHEACRHTGGHQGTQTALAVMACL